VPASSRLVLLAFLLATPAGAVTITPDARAPLAPGPEARAYAAIGAVRCGAGQGTAAMVSSNRIIVTAAHVLYGPDGRLRASGPACRFVIAVGGSPRAVPLRTETIRAGSTVPHDRPAAEDWAVVELAEPVEGALPLAPSRATPGAPARLVSARALDRSGRLIGQQCRLRDRAGAELRFDCSAEPGDSGAPVLDARGAFVGLYVGFRSAAPMMGAAYGPAHYNFALAIEGALRAAIDRAAGR
jgi:hypothetical protein